MPDFNIGMTANELAQALNKAKNTKQYYIHTISITTSLDIEQFRNLTISYMTSSEQSYVKTQLGSLISTPLTGMISGGSYGYKPVTVYPNTSNNRFDVYTPDGVAWLNFSQITELSDGVVCL